MDSSEFKAKRRLDYKKPDFTVTSIDLTFRLSDDKTNVRATAHYVRKCADVKAPLRLDGENLQLVDVLVNNEVCKYNVTESELIVYDLPNEFDLTTEVVISPVTNTSLMGLYKSGGCFCTQCEPDGFRRITYFPDRPDVLARYRVTIIGPEYGCGVLLSNGNLVDRGVRDGRNFTVWEDPFPKPSYLFALVAGSFDTLRDTYTTASGREVGIELYVDRGMYERGKWALESVKAAMEWDEKRFNLEYDLDNFKVVAVDFFNFGAMENKSLNIFNSSCVLVDPETATDHDYFRVQGVIGHEYFHNWTGDRVTLRDWFQLSLKESLTTFRDQEFSSDVNSRLLTRLEAIDVICRRQFAEDAGPMAHPVRPEQVMEMNNFYTVTIYDKGAEVIRMIHTILGEEKFLKGVAYYLSHFDGSAATIEDFVLSMETASLVDLLQFRRWYTQAGTPVVNARWNYVEEEKRLDLTLSQETPPTPNQKSKEPFVIPVRTSFLSAQGEVVTPEELPENGVLILNGEEQTFSFTGLEAGCIPVLLKDFSAPVRLNAAYTAEDHKALIEHADDGFVRIHALFELVDDYVHKHIDKAASGGLPEPSEIIEAMGHVLNDESMEMQLKAKLLNVPDIMSLMESFKRLNLDSLKYVRDFVETSCARSLLEGFENLARATSGKGKYRYTPEEAARRALNRACLKMFVIGKIAEGETDVADDKIFRIYESANNMTDRLAAFELAVHHDLPCKSKLLESFTESYMDDALTFDKFFSVQASVPSEETVSAVRRLMNHQAFDITNPNRVRALIGTFAYSNPVALHQKDGNGYQLIFDAVKKLVKINPSVASRVLDGIINYHRLDDGRRNLVIKCLTRIRDMDNVSKSVYEKVTAALPEESQESK